MFNFELEQEDTVKQKAKVKEVQKKKEAKKYEPTWEEVWSLGYESHTGKRKQGIFQAKNSDKDMERLQEVKKAIEDGTLPKGVESHQKFTKAHALRLYGFLEEMLREQKLEAMVKDTPDNYILVMDSKQILSMVEALEKEQYIPADTETTGLNLYGKDKVVGASFSAPSQDLHYYIPLRHDEANAPFDLAMQSIKEIFSWTNKEFIFHNAVFDLHQLRNEGIEVEGTVHDTQQIMAVLSENEPSYRLKDLVTKYLKLPSDTFDTLFGKDCRFNTVALKYARYYGCKDTHVAWLLFQFQMEHLKKQKGLYNYYMNVEQPLIKVVFEMEREGFIIDMEEVENQKKYLKERIPQVEAELKLVLGDINIASPAQLLPALQREVDPDLESTGKDALKPYKAHPVIVLLKEYKDLSKQLNGFVEPIKEFIQPDGKLHGSFKQNGARTGRFSSVQPNLQQQSPEARKMFKVDGDSLILGLDFAAQEPRLLAHYTQEPLLIENYRNGRDLYATMASEFYGKSYEECYKTPEGSDTKERKTFKVVMLAISYGMGAGSLSSSLGITKKEAQDLLDGFYEKFPLVAQFVKNNTREACKQGYVEMVLGDMVRKRRLVFMKGKNPNKTYDTYSTNAKIQGTAAIQTKLCMIEGAKLCKELSRKGRTFGLLSAVHDELLFRVPKDVTREEVAQFERVMTETVKLNNVKSGTDGELSNCWGTLVPVKKHFEK